MDSEGLPPESCCGRHCRFLKPNQPGSEEKPVRHHGRLARLMMRMRAALSLICAVAGTRIRRWARFEDAAKFLSWVKSSKTSIQSLVKGNLARKWQRLPHK